MPTPPKLKKLKTTTLGIRISRQMLANLHQHATDKGISLGELVRRIIDEWIDRRQQPPTVKASTVV